MIRKFTTYILSGLTLLLGSCVRDSGETHCRSYVRFVYDYNMAFEDLFHNQACKMDLYMFDDDGTFVDLISQERAEGTFDRDYRILLPDGLPYPLHLIAWSGIHPETCNAATMVPGVSTREELIVQLNDCTDNIFDASLRGLWHGTAVILEENTGIKEEITPIYLTKNTNSLRIILQVLDEQTALEAEDFTFTLECVNGSYDHTNAVKYNHDWIYRPFYTATDPHVGVIAEIHTLRLMENSKNNLTITYGPHDQPVIDVDLTRYLNALKLQSYYSMPLQEYMDREDEYRIVIFLKYIKDPDPDKSTWIAAEVTINEWFVREQTEG